MATRGKMCDWWEGQISSSKDKTILFPWSLIWTVLLLWFWLVPLQPLEGFPYPSKEAAWWDALVFLHLWRPAQTKQYELVMILGWRRMKLALSSEAMTDENGPILEGNMHREENTGDPQPPYGPASRAKCGMLGQGGLSYLSSLSENVNSFEHFLFCPHLLCTYGTTGVFYWVSLQWKNMQQKVS